MAVTGGGGFTVRARNVAALQSGPQWLAGDWG